MPNPLLEPHLLPPFSRIQPEHVEPAIRQLIETNKLRIEELLATDKGHTWGNLLQPIEELEDGLAKAWSPVSHLNSVCNSEALREAYNACLPLLSEYSTWMGQHSDLCAAYQQIADGKSIHNPGYGTAKIHQSIAARLPTCGGCPATRQEERLRRATTAPVQAGQYIRRKRTRCYECLV